MIHDQKLFAEGLRAGRQAGPLADRTGLGQFALGAGTRSVAQAYGGDPAERIRRFLPMVRRLAWHLQSSGRDGIELEDLMQAGLVALTECAQRHTGPSEDGFAAYAKLRVRGAMVDLIRRHVPLSRGAVER